MMSILRTFVLLILFFLSFPQPTFAHAFGQFYNLPVPFHYYVFGAIVALGSSFLVFGFFTPAKVNQQKIKLFPLNILRRIERNFMLVPVQAFSIFLFLLTITSGLFGVNDSYSNFNMTFFWVVFYLGLTYMVAIFGNIYTVINPIKIITHWGELYIGGEITGIKKYPEKLSYWPAFIFYLTFIWIELSAQFDPLNLSIVIVLYTLISFFGIYIVGAKKWFTYCDFFSVYFYLISLISPFIYKSKKVYVVLPLSKALQAPDVKSFSLLIFILFVLSSTAFDGFRELIVWQQFYWASIDPLLRPIFGDNTYFFTQNIMLLISPFVFFFLYFVANLLSKAIANINFSPMSLCFRFAYSLIPIAFAYNFAHYFTLIVTQGVQMLNLASDPFGVGWDIFGTAEFSTNIIVDPNITWHTQVFVILLGHIAGVYMAHAIAARILQNKRQVLLSQIPITILMVIYTVIGLWILSQPLSSGV